MTAALAERRKARVLTLFLIAGALAATAAVTLGIQMRGSNPNAAAGPVLPGLENTIGGAQRISIVNADATYRIERTQQGWAMRDRDDYPVQAARLAQLTEGLESLRYVRRMTRDASKHERLGVTDPREGGRGILVQVEDGRGALLVNLILGVEPNGLYVRRPDDGQTWAAEGELPPLRDVASWMDLRPITLDGARLARVEIVPNEGRPYILGREGADQPWHVVAPALDATSPLVTSTAERIVELSPIDVRTAPAIQGPPLARVRALTFDGVMIDAELIASDGKTWVKLVARPSAPEQEAAALEINNRVAPWAYALNTLEAESLAPSLGRLLPAAP